MNTEKEKFSYTMGQQIGGGIQKDGLDVDADALTLGLQHSLKGEPSVLSNDEMRAVIENFQKQAASHAQNQASDNQARGAAFLADNQNAEGVVTLDSGLQYVVIEEGTGDTPQAHQHVKVHYQGTLISGREFDSSIRRGEPAVFPVNGVIQGWQQALQLMPVGSKWKVFIPPHLAYGEQGAGGAIGPNETLIFEMELLGIE